MKQEKGVTTASIIVYVIIITIAISLLTVLTGYFRNILSKNLRHNEDYEKYITFTNYFVQDIQEEGNKVVEVANYGDPQYKDDTRYEENVISYLRFSNNNVYRYIAEERKIYRNQIEICDNIDLCYFDKEEENGKTKITVQFATGKFIKTKENALVFYM